jgi:hypothetical protein
MEEKTMDDDAKDANDGNVVGMRDRRTAPQPTPVQITLDLDETSFVSHGRHASDGTVVILTDAVVWTDSAPAARVVAFGAGNVARMLSARINQDMMPVRATASWDGVCWNVEAILSDAKAA